MNRVTAFCVALMALALLGGCATGVQPDDPYAIRVDHLSKQVDKLSHIVENQNKASLGQHLDQLTEQVRTLRGQVQELAHAVDESNNRQRDLYQDLDKRLRKLETAAGGETGGAGNAGQVPGEKSGRTAYDHAFNLLQQGDYDQAKKAFTAFLSNHGDSDLADNAQYWLGEVHYVTKDFKGAVDAFKAVVNAYPDSSKVPGALLKMGYSYAALSDWKEARDALNKVVKKYPKSTEARLAKDRLKKLKNEGH